MFFLSDMTRSPVSGIWQKQTTYAEIATAVDVIFYQNSDLDGKVTVRKPIGVQLSAFTTEGGIAGTIYTDAGKTTSVPLTTIITENKVFYYG